MILQTVQLWQYVPVNLHSIWGIYLHEFACCCLDQAIYMGNLCLSWRVLVPAWAPILGPKGSTHLSSPNALNVWNPGISREFPGESWEFLGNPRESQEIPGNPGKSREIPGIHGKSRKFPGNPWKSREILGNPRISQEIPGNPKCTPFNHIPSRLILAPGLPNGTKMEVRDRPETIPNVDLARNGDLRDPYIIYYVKARKSTSWHRFCSQQ